MRSSEIAGLRRQDVDLTFGEIGVAQTFHRVPKYGDPRRPLGGWVWQPPKSRYGERPIPLHSMLVEELRGLFAAQDALRKEFGPQYADLGEHGPLVFCQPDGAPMHMGNFERGVYKKILADAKVPAIRLHDLRHGFASLLGKQGVSANVLQQLLGHHDPGFTLRTYRHVFAREKSEATLRLVESVLRLSPETGSTPRETAGTHKTAEG